MVLPGKKWLYVSTLFIAGGLIVFGFSPSASSAISRKLSSAQMASVRGLLDCEDHKQHCGGSDKAITPYNDDECDSVQTAIIRKILPGETPAAYQAYYDGALPRCPAIIITHELKSPKFFDTKKGRDTEKDKKADCIGQRVCSDPGTAAPSLELGKDPRGHDTCVYSAMTESHCKICTGSEPRRAPDFMQPDVLKCKDDDE